VRITLLNPNFHQDIGGQVYLKNLAINTVNSEEEALNALFLGDTNRFVGRCFCSCSDMVSVEF
jgi:hypothetical protein